MKKLAVTALAVFTFSAVAEEAIITGEYRI